MPLARLVIAIALVLGAPALAHAEWKIDPIDTSDGIIVGTAHDDAFRPLADAIVRVVGERVVVALRSDATGGFRVTGLPLGHYRIEIERGPSTAVVSDLDSPRGLDRTYPLCFGEPLSGRTFVLPARNVAPPPRKPPLTDTHSTARGVRLGPRELVGP